MSRSFHLKRFKLALCALTLALGALYVQHTGILPLRSEFTASTVLETELLPQITLPVLRATVHAPHFSGTLATPVDIEGVTGHPQRFRLFTTHTNPDVAESALSRSRQLLQLELRTLATQEIENSRQYLEERLEREKERLQDINRRPQLHRDSRPQESLSTTETRRAIRLRQELKDINRFLRTGRYPTWLKREIDGQDLRLINSEIQEAEKELKALKKRFKPSSKTIAKQEKLLKQVQNERRKLRLELAQALLKDRTRQYKALEDKNLALIEAKLEDKSEPRSSKPTRPDGESTKFLLETSEELAKKAHKLEKLATLRSVSSVKLTQTQASGYWASFVLWTGALAFLLGALFTSTRTAPLSTTAPPIPLSRPTPPAPKTPQTLDSVYLTLESALGRAPKTVLVLGNESGLARSAFSLRLAKTFGASDMRVKLVDFDLTTKELTHRLGDQTTPGVGEVLTSGGAVEEFFASLPGTNIEFAAAGSPRILREPICSEALNALLEGPVKGVTLIDASFNSPLHLLIGHVDAVLCLTEHGVNWSEQEEQVLLALREAKLPMWGVPRGRGEGRLFPYI